MFWAPAAVLATVWLTQWLIPSVLTAEAQLLGSDSLYPLALTSFSSTTMNVFSRTADAR